MKNGLMSMLSLITNNPAMMKKYMDNENIFFDVFGLSDAERQSFRAQDNGEKLGNLLTKSLQELATPGKVAPSPHINGAKNLNFLSSVVCNSYLLQTYLNTFNKGDEGEKERENVRQLFNVEQGIAKEVSTLFETKSKEDFSASLDVILKAIKDELTDFAAPNFS